MGIAVSLPLWQRRNLALTLDTQPAAPGELGIIERDREMVVTGSGYSGAFSGPSGMIVRTGVDTTDFVVLPDRARS